jgi:hypothetical protein
VRRTPAASDSLRCSFCHKSQDIVSSLLSSPRDCNECVAVCAAIIEDDSEAAEAPIASSELCEETHPLLMHPLASPFLASVERWIRRESLGDDASEEFAEMRNIAIRLMSGAS